jgi:hypothetical protein
MNRELKRFGLLVVSTIVITLIVRVVALGGASVVNLAAAPPLSGNVSIGIGPRNNKQLQVAGRDFQLENIQYFDSNQWVTATVKPVNEDSDTGVVVLKKINGIYQVVMGPGNEFSSSYTFVLPTDISQYLSRQGLLHE